MHEFPLSLVSKQSSNLSFLKQDFLISSLNFPFHRLEACLRPYNDLLSLQTLFSKPFVSE